MRTITFSHSNPVTFHPCKRNVVLDCLPFVFFVCYLVWNMKQLVRAWINWRNFNSFYENRKPVFDFSGYQYWYQPQNSKLSWVCVKDKWGKCKGKLKTTWLVKRTIVSFQTQLEWRLQWNWITAGKRVGEEVSVPVDTICKEEWTDV